MHIPKLVLEGGPGGGKTTGLPYFTQKLGDLGHHVLMVPEAPTLLLTHGIRPGPGHLRHDDFQQAILDLAIGLEQIWERAASALPPARKPVLLYDRGVMSILGYLEGLNTRTRFSKWLADRELTIVAARDLRYDAIYHLQTAAIGAEAYYTLENNPARYETLDQARERDEKIREAWSGHPHHHIIPNRGGFDQKLKEALTWMCRDLGIPEPIETERKFLVDPRFSRKSLGAHAIVEIEQFYLLSSDKNEELRFRKRSQYGDSAYFETRKRPGLNPSSRYERERFIAAREYEFGKQFKAPGSRFVRKKRHCFAYEHQCFELDEFVEPRLPYCLLELELADPGQPMTLPPFLKVVREVTGEKEWSNYALATRP